MGYFDGIVNETDAGGESHIDKSVPLGYNDLHSAPRGEYTFFNNPLVRVY